MAGYTPSLQHNIGFTNALQLLKPHSLEETVQQVWQEIVIEWFPGRYGYKWSFKAPTLANNNMPDVTVIEVTAVVQNPRASQDWDERQIMVIECKCPSKDTPMNWEDTVDYQLMDDLSRTLNFSERLFAAVAIGKKVRFYRFDGKEARDQKLVQLHQGTFDMSDSNGIAQVEDMMNYIKANAWAWADSK